MSAAYTILLSWPSLCQKLSKLMEFDEVLTKTILAVF